MIIDVNWTIDEIKDLKYTNVLANFDNAELFLQAGHSKKHMSIQNYFESNTMPESILNVKQYFDWNNCTVAINLLKPGRYLPTHSDLYTKYANLFKINNIENIQRAIIMIEDWLPGQMIEVDNVITNKWVAGQVFTWTGKVKHAAYNFSLKNRYAIQVTGWL